MGRGPWDGGHGPGAMGRGPWAGGRGPGARQTIPGIRTTKITATNYKMYRI